MNSAANGCFSFASSSLVSFGSLRSWVHGVGTSLRVARSRRYDGRCPRFTSTVDPSCNWQRCPNRQKQHEKNGTRMGREWASSARFEEHLKTCLRDESLFHLVCGHGYKDHFATCLWRSVLTCQGRVLALLIELRLSTQAKALCPKNSRLIQTSSRSTHVRSRRSRLPLESWCSATARKELQLLSSHLQRMGMLQLGASMSL